MSNHLARFRPKKKVGYESVLLELQEIEEIIDSHSSGSRQRASHKIRDLILTLQEYIEDD